MKKLKKKSLIIKVIGVIRVIRVIRGMRGIRVLESLEVMRGQESLKSVEVYWRGLQASNNKKYLVTHLNIIY